MKSAFADPAGRAARARTLEQVQRAVTGCEACPRLRAWCEKVAREKRRAYADADYWGKPVPGFGDPGATILIVGLAPAAHGGNRTGRIFTGDRSGDFLFAALHRAGLANQPTSVARDDGLRLRGVYVAAAARCAPPANKLRPDEVSRCLHYLVRESELLPRLRAVVALGRVAHDGWLEVLRRRGLRVRAIDAPFAHGAEARFDGAGAPWPALLDSYHVSQQNTFTGRLTPAMLDAVLDRARALARD
jgi:uracil-DNA glycosylase family 4